MFTGIIESCGLVTDILEEGTNIHYTIESSFGHELKIDQSVAHDGICLTVVKLNGKLHTVTAIAETINRSSIKNWKKGTIINLERCMPANGRFDGHIVQGHVDTTATCKSVKDLNGSWEFRFNHAISPVNITVPKGSITINGTSLTIVDSSPEEFSVCIIPYTFEHTNFKQIKAGDTVNLEFDIIGKYVARLLNNKL